MKHNVIYFLSVIISFFGFDLVAQPIPSSLIKSSGMMRVRPVESNEVLSNPGIGFMTFQRFNGDDLNPGIGWTEGLPIVYQPFDGNLENDHYPHTTLAYFRVDWAFVEPESGKYNWAMIDSALMTARNRGQTLILRIAPYEGLPQDVPAWYRKMVGNDRTGLIEKWQVDPENPLYIKHFGGLIQKLGERYDGHPDMEAVDISIVGYWGEGEGSHLLTDETRIKLLNAYLENFTYTQLLFQPLNGDAPDAGKISSGTDIFVSWPDGRQRGFRKVGYRFDCLGDLGTTMWRDQQWSHMEDIYPRDIIKSGMYEAWKYGHVSGEICGTFGYWKDSLRYDRETVQHIFNESLKWHISSFNAKSSAVPDEFRDLVDQWITKMGYRYVLRRLEYPSNLKITEPLSITALWENVGVAPIYKTYKLAFRLKNGDKIIKLISSEDLRKWLPGDIVYEEQLTLPKNIAAARYQLEMAIIHPINLEPAVKIAIKGENEDGWYSMGIVDIIDKGKK